MVKVALTDEIWAILNDPMQISNKDYDYLMCFFSHRSKYEFFIVTVGDFREKILEEWNAHQKFMNFYEFVHKHEFNPRRYLYANDRPRDKANFLAFKAAQYLSFDDIEAQSIP